MTSHQWTILALPSRFAICRLEPTAPLPSWSSSDGFCSITRTADEMSIVCLEQAVPEGTKCEKGWRCLRVAGTIEFSVVGVLAALVTPLAEAGISVLAISTFDTDYLLVKEKDFEKTVAALRQQGHMVE